MNNRTPKEIVQERNEIEDRYKGEYVIADSFFTYTTLESVKEPLYKLGNALELLAWCDAAVFCPGWEEARGCQIEHLAAELYGIKILED